MELEIGDVVVFHSLVVHGSLPNPSRNHRRGLIMCFNGKNAPVRDCESRIIPFYKPIELINDSQIIQCGIKPHSPKRNDFLGHKQNKASLNRINQT